MRLQTDFIDRPPARPATKTVETQTDVTQIVNDVNLNQSFISCYSQSSTDTVPTPDSEISEWAPSDLNDSIRSEVPHPAKERKFLVFESALDQLVDFP